MIESNLASFEWPRFGMEVGSSVVVGGIAGFVAKKIAKLFLVLLGLELLFLRALEIHDVIEVRWGQFEGLVASVRNVALGETPPSGFLNALPSLTVGGGFAGGFLFGFRRA